MAKSTKSAAAQIVENTSDTMAGAFGATVTSLEQTRRKDDVQAVTSETKSAIAADINGTVLTLTFSHGEVIECDGSKLTDEMKTQAMMHGLKQKLVDAAAIARDVDTGRTASIRDKFEAVNEVFERIMQQGQWNKVREGGAGGNNGLLVRALAELTGKTRSAVEEFLDAKSKEEKQALRKNAKVAAIIVRMQAEGADDSIDTDAMLDELS